jgi:hypothetical protein
MTESVNKLARIVQTLHGVNATHQGIFFVRGVSNTEAERNVSVHLFSLKGHTRASRAFAWEWTENGEVSYMAVLDIPPIHSPREAVQSAIASRRQRSVRVSPTMQ